MLRFRLIAAACIIGPLLFLCWADDAWNFGVPGIWLVPLGFLVSLVAVFELLTMLAKGDTVPTRFAMLAAAVVYCTAAVPMVWRGQEASPLDRLGLTLLGVVLGFLIVMLAEMARYPTTGSAINNAAVSILAFLYIGLPMAFLAHLRLLSHDRHGLLTLISVLFIVKVCDAGAFFVGRSMGRRKLAPRLSPNKTIEGAVGAVVSGCLASCVYFAVIVRWLGSQPAGNSEYVSWMVYGAVLAVAGMIGDLAESLIKRDAQQKDSGSWLPGLGGVLDVVDSVLFAAPVAFCWWALPI